MKIEDILKQHTDAIEKQFSALSADVQKALEETGFLKAVTQDIGQKLARADSAARSFSSSSGESWGAQFIEADGLKAFAENSSHPGRFRVEVKTITSAPASGGALGGQAYRDDVAAIPQRKLHVRSLLPTIEISTGSVEYPKQTTRTNAAAPVAEDTLKPQSDYQFVMEIETAKTIAHWILASRQILDDSVQLRDTIDSELRYGLALAEDGEILNGTGTGEHLDGLIKNATAYAAPIDPAGTETMLDQVALAMLQTSLADFEANGIVLHPSDWMLMRLLKNTQGEYLLGDPGANVPQVLFGAPVVTTVSMAQDKFLVGDFLRAATLYDRLKPRVEVSTEDSDNFRKNLVTILAEERIALAVKQGKALTYGDFGNVALAARSAGKAK